MKTSIKILLSGLFVVLLSFFPTESEAQYQFGYLSYRKALQSMPEYAAAQQSLRTLKSKYDEEAKYNEEKFKKMFADFLDGQKNFPEEILLKRQKELQVGMEQGIAFRKDAERLLSKAEDELMAPLTNRLDSTLALIGRENGFIFIVNTDNKDFPFIHSQAGKDLTEIVIARLNGRTTPINEKPKSAMPTPTQEPAGTTPATETPTQQQ